MKNYLILLMMWLTILSGSDIKLAENGNTVYKISIHESASELEKRAAGELSRYLNQITGAEFTVIANAPSPRIAIGPELAGTAGLIMPELGNEGFIINSKGRDIHITGGTSNGRGTLYGVYEFLEKLGCRFWTEKEETIPRKTTIILKAMDIVQRPAFPHHRFLISWTTRPRWTDGKLKLNGTSFGYNKKLTARDGIVSDIEPHNAHTYRFFLPATKYGKTNPEFFALQKGRRFADDLHSQLCLTNLEMTREFIKNCREYLKNNYHEGMILEISQNDSSTPCECENCKSVDAEEGSPGGTLLRFVNRIGQALAQDYPGLRIQAKAYSYTVGVPRITSAENNVLVSFNNLHGDLAAAHDSSTENRRLFEDLRGWSRKARRLGVGDNGTIFKCYLAPLPNFETLAGRLRDYRDLGVCGISSINVHNTPYGELDYLRDYLTAKLWWNPNLDPWQVAGEFCTGYYGAAGQHIYDYIRWYHRALKDIQFFFHHPPLHVFNREFTDRAMAFYALAFEAVKDDPILTRRVERAYAATQFLWLFARLNEIPASPELLKKLDEFEEVCKKFDIRRMSEGGLMKNFFETARLRVEWPAFCRNIPITDRVAIMPDILYPVKRISDPLVANTVCCMPATHQIWALQKPSSYTGGTFDGDERWDAYVRVRIIPADGATPQTVAFRGGYTEPETKKTHKKDILLPETSSTEYRYIKIAERFPVSAKSYIWIAPAGNPDQIEEIRVDHFLFIKSK